TSMPICDASEHQLTASHTLDAEPGAQPVMPDTEQPTPVQVFVPHRISGTIRWLLGVAGTAAIAAGTAAVFAVKGNGGAGAAALLAVGVGAVVLGGIGTLPTKVNVAGVELSLPQQV